MSSPAAVTCGEAPAENGTSPETCAHRQLSYDARLHGVDCVSKA